LHKTPTDTNNYKNNNEELKNKHANIQAFFLCSSLHRFLCVSILFFFLKIKYHQINKEKINFKRFALSIQTSIFTLFFFYLLAETEKRIRNRNENLE
jgi:hypothetical protein